MKTRLNFKSFLGLIVFVSILLLSWTKGNHSETWEKGGTIKVFVKTPPGDAAQQAQYRAAVADAIAKWNTIQAAFGGLTLEITTDPAEQDVEVNWEANADSWGSVASGKDPVKVTVESNDGLNIRGITRILIHEFGHVEGLGHSAKSKLMEAKAYGKDGKKPTKEDLNSANDYILPTDDDKAGKKALWGTVEKLSKSVATSDVVFDPNSSNYVYTYELTTLPDYTDPVSEFTIELPLGITEENFVVSIVPSGWNYEFYNGIVIGNTKSLDEGEVASPSLLQYYTEDPAGSGAFPGDVFYFQIMSPHAPIIKRAFTNSPSFDSDEFEVQVPSPPPGSIPTLNQWGVIILLLLVLAVGMVFLYQRQTSLAMAGVSEASGVKPKLFDSKLFSKIFAVTLLIGIVGLVAAYLYYGQITNADPFGTVVSAGIVAYIAHLWLLRK